MTMGGPTEPHSAANHTLTRKAFLVTSQSLGAAQEKLLESLECANELHRNSYLPILQQYGEVIAVNDPKMQLDQTAIDARARGLDPIHVSFIPFQDLPLCKSAPNIAVCAWEYPNTPNHDFENTLQRNWKTAANACDMVLVNGDFTADTLRQSGVDTPILNLPTPVRAECFTHATWKPDQETFVPCRAYWPTNVDEKRTVRNGSRRSAIRESWHYFKVAMTAFGKCVLGPVGYRDASKELAHRFSEYRRRKLASAHAMKLDLPSTPELRLSGIVYTCIVDPQDTGKNWRDAMTAYLLALSDCPDATLVVNLTTRNREYIKQAIQFYQDREFLHRSKIAFVIGYLSDEAMSKLTQATTYFLQTSRAERVCYPMVDFLGAGRPAISPSHSAIRDYFDENLGFVIDSSNEPASWPQDHLERLRTNWARVHWPSCLDAIRRSYELAKTHYHQYVQMSTNCRTATQQLCSPDAVKSCLHSALCELELLKSTSKRVEQPVVIKFDPRHEAPKKRAA